MLLAKPSQTDMTLASGPTDVVSPTTAPAESFRDPPKSVGASKSNTFAKEWPVPDENGISPPDSPGKGMPHVISQNTSAAEGEEHKAQAPIRCLLIVRSM